MTDAPASALPGTHPLTSGLTSGSPARPCAPWRPTRDAPRVVHAAGRAFAAAEYRELRVGTAMLDACLDPAMASEITLQPVRRHGVDAGIFFSDIVVPIKLAGVDVEIVPVAVRSSAPRSARQPTWTPCSPSTRRRSHRSPRPSRGRSPSSGARRSSGSPARPSPSPPTWSRAVRRRTTSAPARLMHADPETWSACSPGRRTCRGRSSARRCSPEPRPRSSSTRGGDRCRVPTTSRPSRRTPPGRWSTSRTSASHGSTSASAAARSCTT